MEKSLLHFQYIKVESKNLLPFPIDSKAIELEIKDAEYTTEAEKKAFIKGWCTAILTLKLP